MKMELKPWSLDDEQPLIALYERLNRDYLPDNLSFPGAGEGVQWWLEKVLKHDEKYAIFRKIVLDGELAGHISVEKKADIFKKDAELEYFLDEPFWSQGIMTQAVSQVCDRAFSCLDILRISASVFSANMASRKVLEKNGFLLEGICKNAVFKKDQLYDLYLYGKLKKESI